MQWKHAQKISASLGQRDTVITFDLAIYAKAKQIQMKFPEEFSDIVIRLGGFHIALNFLSLLGKKFRSSGLEDLLIESGVYAAGTTTALMKGKYYNREIRAHKLAMEALFRLMWDVFVAWYAGLTGDGGECEERVVNKDAVITKAEECRRDNNDGRGAGLRGEVAAGNYGAAFAVSRFQRRIQNKVKDVCLLGRVWAYG